MMCNVNDVRMDERTDTKHTLKTDQCTTQMIKNRYLATNLFYLQYASNNKRRLNNMLYTEEMKKQNHILKQTIIEILRSRNLFVKVSYLQYVCESVLPSIRL